VHAAGLSNGVKRRLDYQVTDFGAVDVLVNLSPISFPKLFPRHFAGVFILAQSQENWHPELIGKTGFSPRRVAEVTRLRGNDGLMRKPRTTDLRGERSVVRGKVS